MLVIGNWKMNGGLAQLSELAELARKANRLKYNHRAAVCPPATLLGAAAKIMNLSSIELGGQDCHYAAAGAFTGDISAPMLAELGARFVIVGHSERRQGHRETDLDVAAKAASALAAGLQPIICIGEDAEARASGNAVATVRRQLERSLPVTANGHQFSVAYEPIWAIGSGITPSDAEIGAVSHAIREVLRERCPSSAKVSVVYGGSVSPSNAARLCRIEHVGGLLVGGASLTANAFLAILAEL